MLVLVGELATLIVRVKQEKKVINNAFALRLLAELVVGALDSEEVVPEATTAPTLKVA